MDTLKDMNLALAYIEDHLGDEVDLAQAACLARSSEYHFKTMFAYLAGMTLGEYIRRRRLTRAGFELSNPANKVIDVALRYGYQSPDSFTKAFYQWHGINPSDARKPGASLKAFPRMAFQLTIKGGNAMDYRIEEKPSFTLIGVQRRIPLVYEGENAAITTMLGLITPELQARLKQLADVEPYGGYSASFNFSEREKEGQAELDHLIGVASTATAAPGCDTHSVPALTWAVFTVNGGPEEAQQLWARIYAEWLPTSDYEVSEGPEILFTARQGDGHREIWIPVQKRSRPGHS